MKPIIRVLSKRRTQQLVFWVFIPPFFWGGGVHYMKLGEVKELYIIRVLIWPKFESVLCTTILMQHSSYSQCEQNYSDLKCLCQR